MSQVATQRKLSPCNPRARALGEDASRQATLDCCNEVMAGLDARERVQWALENLPGKHILSSSFGAQSAVALHLVTQEQPDIPVVLVDTGYLFGETYRFIGSTLFSELYASSPAAPCSQRLPWRASCQAADACGR